MKKHLTIYLIIIATILLYASDMQARFTMEKIRGTAVCRLYKEQSEDITMERLEKDFSDALREAALLDILFALKDGDSPVLTYLAKVNLRLTGTPG